MNSQSLAWVGIFCSLMAILFAFSGHSHIETQSGAGTLGQSTEQPFPNVQPNIQTDHHVIIGPQGFYQFCKDHKQDADKCLGN